MNRFLLLGASVLLAFGTTLGLDLYQRKLAHPGRETIIFASMWATGEPLQQAYERLFAEFEREYPQYKVEPRFDGRWVLPAIRPRLLTGSDVPDVLNLDQEALRILVTEGYARPLDEILDVTPHPDDATQTFRAAFNPKVLERCRLEGAYPGPDGTVAPSAIYILPTGMWTSFIFYNRVHYEQLGLQPPRTWTEFLENCRRLKAAGICPVAADAYEYADFWVRGLVRRAVSEETYFASIAGQGPRFDDPRYRAAFQAIRDLHQPGWFMEGWNGSQWPAAQRHWVMGKATHIINGSWLIRETLSYGADEKRFRAGAFLIPAIDVVEWGAHAPQPLGDPTGVDASICGHALLKGSRNPAGAVALVRFLARRASAQEMAAVGKEIPAVNGVSFPPELEELRRDFEAARTIYQGDAIVAKWRKFALRDLYYKFFMHASPDKADFLTVDQFARELQQATNRYNAAGGETGIR